MRNRYFYSSSEVLEEAKILVNTPGASTYTVATQLDMPQATVWYHLTYRLPVLDISLFTQVQAILRKNYKGGGR